MSPASDTLALTLNRFIRASRAKVFDAFVNEGMLARWHCARGMLVASVSVDARVRGAWRIDMRTRERESHTVGGQYREIQRPSSLAYTWVWEYDGSVSMAGVQTLVEVDFVEHDDGTEVRLRHSGFPAATARDSHAEGWSSVLNRLTDALDARGSAASLTLFGDPRSSYTWAARLGLAEKGIAYTLQPCPAHGPELNAIHPFGRMPALRDGTTELWETSAILRYIDEGFDGPVLNAGTVVDRARTEQWVSAVGAYMYDAMARRYVLQYLFAKGNSGQPSRAVIDQAVQDMVRPLDALEKVYANRDYIAGEAPSYADLMVTPLLSYIAKFPEGAQLLSDRPNIRRAQTAMRARPSFAATDPARAQ
jgi:glutathione S-transferase